MRALAEERLAGEIAAHRAADGEGDVEGEPACRRSMARFLETAPPLTVVVASRDRPEQLVTCVSTLLAMDYPRLEIIVVDNAPSSDATARLVAERFGGRPEVRYLREDRPGDVPGPQPGPAGRHARSSWRSPTTTCWSIRAGRPRWSGRWWRTSASAA